MLPGSEITIEGSMVSQDSELGVLGIRFQSE